MKQVRLDCSDVPLILININNTRWNKEQGVFKFNYNISLRYPCVGSSNIPGIVVPAGKLKVQQGGMSIPAGTIFATISVCWYIHIYIDC